MQIIRILESVGGSDVSRAGLTSRHLMGWGGGGDGQMQWRPDPTQVRVHKPLKCTCLPV